MAFLTKDWTTRDVVIPNNPLEQVIGQAEAVTIAKLASSQRRHLLLVGPPGIGKSMLAQAVAFSLPTPTQEISVLHNPENPERPFIEVRTKEQAEKESKLFDKIQGPVCSPKEVPAFVAEKLGFRCPSCAKLSRSTLRGCPYCGTNKRKSREYTRILGEYSDDKIIKSVQTTRLLDDGREEIMVYEVVGEKIRVLDQKALETIEKFKRQKPRKILVPFDRNTFIIATGASETELLGDVRHDPYGGHQGLGTLPYSRTVAGSVHDAHEGVLFIDELSSLQYVQRYLFTAMQEKKYPIVGRNPQSAGSSVRVEGVPCDFVLIAASNINDLHQILPPLRSRIIGNGYEVLLDTFMPDSKENCNKLVQFIAQEVIKDGKIPHCASSAVEEIIEQARVKAKKFDGEENALTLRLRELSGVLRLAGDLAVLEESKLITGDLVRDSLKRGRAIEEQLQEKYGSLWKAGLSEVNKEERREQKEVS
ncbi:MAG: ATP-binding protein [Candidatus Micrarchaeota archaeon]